MVSLTKSSAEACGVAERTAMAASARIATRRITYSLVVLTALMRGSIELIHLPARPAAVTRGLDPRKSDVSDFHPFKLPELGNTRVLLVHLLRINVFLPNELLSPKS